MSKILAFLAAFFLAACSIEVEDLGAYNAKAGADSSLVAEWIKIPQASDYTEGPRVVRLAVADWNEDFTNGKWKDIPWPGSDNKMLEVMPQSHGAYLYVQIDGKTGKDNETPVKRSTLDVTVSLSRETTMAFPYSATRFHETS